ncbi:MAG: hypothetical protein RL009_677 [Actinomycetota bacterium]
MSTNDELALTALVSHLESGALAKTWLPTARFESPDCHRQVLEVISITRTLGSPVLPALRQLQQMWTQDRLQRTELESEMAAPRLTKRLISWLPVGALASAQLMGFDVVGAIASPIALVSFVVGAGMLALANRWCNSIIAKAMPEPDAVLPQLRNTLLMLSSGATWVQTKTHISLGEETTRTLAPLLKVSRRSGAPISHIIEREIRVLNDRRLAEAKTKLSEASVKLSLPMGLAMLPALVFLVVIPVFITMSSSPSQMALQS